MRTAAVVALLVMSGAAAAAPAAADDSVVRGYSQAQEIRSVADVRATLAKQRRRCPERSRDRVSLAGALRTAGAPGSVSAFVRRARLGDPARMQAGAAGAVMAAGPGAAMAAPGRSAPPRAAPAPAPDQPGGAVVGHRAPRRRARGGRRGVAPAPARGRPDGDRPRRARTQRARPRAHRAGPVPRGSAGAAPRRGLRAAAVGGQPQPRDGAQLRGSNATGHRRAPARRGAPAPGRGSRPAAAARGQPSAGRRGRRPLEGRRSGSAAHRLVAELEGDGRAR